jgi:hypothetical protein
MASFDKQKALDLLENNAQWIAVGAGSLFALWMVYGNLSSPATVEIGSEQVAPGGIASRVTTAKEELQSFSAAAVDYDPPRVNLKTDLVSIANGVKPDQRYALLPGYVFRTPLFTLDQPTATAGNFETPLPNNPNGQQINIPDQLPAAKLVALTSGKTFVDPTAPNPNGPPAAAPPAAGGAPGQAPAAPANARDVIWTRYTYTVALADLAFEFSKRNVPAGYDRTFFLRAELLRQELQPNGEWSAEQVVPWVQWEPLNPFPLKGTEAEQREYFRWAAGKQQPIVQPGFYTILTGDNPAFRTIGDTPLGYPNFDPATFKDSESLLSPDQLRQLREYRAAEAKRKEEERRKNRPPPRPGGRPGGGGKNPGGAGGGPGGGGEFGPRLNPIPPSSGSPGEGAGRPGPTPFQADVGSGFPPSDGPGGMSPTPQPTGPTLEPIPSGPVPTAPIAILDPGQSANVVYGWCYDETVVPGHTYRYRVRYYMINPLRLIARPAAVAGGAPGAPGAAGAPAVPAAPVATFFAMVGEDKNGWSDAVTIPAVTHFFVADAGINVTSNTVKLTIFRWQNGKLHRTVDTYAPGDMIGKVDAAAKIDYRSGWAVVDVRGDNNSNAYVLLMGPDGRLERRTVAGDAGSEQRIRLENEFLNPTPPPGTPPNPGSYPGGPGMPPGGEFGPPGGFVPPARP